MLTLEQMAQATAYEPQFRDRNSVTRRRLLLLALYPHKSLDWHAENLGVARRTIQKYCRRYGLTCADYSPRSYRGGVE